MPERVLRLSRQVSSIATSRVEEIRKITRMMKILGINAAIEAGRADNSSFGVVAREVGKTSASIEKLAESLHDELSAKTAELEVLGRQLVASIRGSRLADLALNMIDIVDRNLYERSCDVRWWATDSAVVDCAAARSAPACDLASSRLGVILDSYTVYLDLWIASGDGTVLANGRPRQYSVRGASVAGEEWFRKAIETKTGAGYAACDIGTVKELGGASVATYATAVRADGLNEGKVIGALGIFFDWEKQSQLVVDSVRLAEEERAGTKCLIIDAGYKIIASHDHTDQGKAFPLKTGGDTLGSYVDRDGNLIGFALTPGYETYPGLGWYGVLAQSGAKTV
jgi:hypothetical protein